MTADLLGGHGHSMSWGHDSPGGHLTYYFIPQVKLGVVAGLAVDSNYPSSVCRCKLGKVRPGGVGVARYSKWKWRKIGGIGGVHRRSQK
jgi:hypothetical protein